MSIERPTDTAEDKISNPAGYYENPLDVLADSTLTKDEKRRVLESLKLDAEEMAVATAENMGGGEEPPRLDRIEKALEALDKTS